MYHPDRLGWAVLGTVALALLVVSAARSAPVPSSMERIGRMEPREQGAASGTLADTLVPVFAVRTDTVVAVGTYQDAAGATRSLVFPAHCGVTMLFAGWAIRKNGVTSAPIARDSVTYTIGGCPAPPNPSDPSDPAAPLGSADPLTFAWRTADGTLHQAPPEHITVPEGSTTNCLYVVAHRAATGALVTGRPVTLHVADTTVAALRADASCPDTTVDPARIP